MKKLLILLALITALAAMLTVMVSAEVISEEIISVNPLKEDGVTPTYNDSVADGVHFGTISFDTETGKLTIARNPECTAAFRISPYKSLKSVDVFVNKYASQVKFIEIGDFERIYYDYDARLCRNFPLVEEIHFVSTNTRHSNGSMIFMNCPNLKTVWFGDDSNRIEGVVNLTGFGASSSDDVAKVFTNGFSGCTSVTRIIFPATINTSAYSKFTYLSDTFNGCTSLISVENLPSTITEIRANTFNGCSALKEIDVPASVTSIGESAFAGCSGLTYIKLNGDVTLAEGSFTGVGGTEDAPIIIQVPTAEIAASIKAQAESAGLTNYSVIDYYIYERDIIRVATGAVMGSMTLNSKTGLLTIKADATLYPCASWASGNSTNHEVREFIIQYKNLIKKVDIQCDTIQPQWQYIFLQNLPELTEVHFSENMRILCAGSIEDTANGRPSESGYGFFLNCPKLKTVYFGDESNRIEGVANLSGFGFFNNRNYLNGMMFRLFKNCTSLEAVILPDLLGMTSLYETFYGCTSLKSVTIPKQFGIIGQKDMDGFEPHGVTYLGGGTFEGCSALEEVIFVTDVDPFEATVDEADFTAIGSNAFKGCTSLKRIAIPDTVTSIAQNAFEGCTSLEYITIPSGVAEIPANAFKGCTSLKNIVIPSTVTSIGANAFEGCTSLKNVNIEGNVTIGANAFKNCSGVKVFCYDSDLEAVAEVVGEYGEAVALDTSAMKFDGFAVRVEGYNGLRSFFTFDESANSDFTLVEYGTLAAQSGIYDSYEESIGGENSIFTISEGVVSTANGNIAKVAVYNKNNTENSGYGDAKYTKEGDITSFTVTVTKFDLAKDQHTAALSIVGYQIWENDGSYYVAFTHTSNEDYREASLYKVAMGMLKDRAILAENSAGPVWEMIEATAVRELDSNIEGYLMPDPLTDGKYVGLYVSENAAELKEYGTTAEERLSLTGVICGKNVTNDLPFLNNTWANHMDAQLAKVPEGKSFIFITDTHDNHVLYSHVLAEYARQKLGIDTVITGGDVYENGATLEEADTKLNYVVDTQFSHWGEAWLYAQGNHDANFTASKQGREYYEYLLPDTNIIAATVDKMTANVVFDQKSIDIATNDVVYTAVGNYTAEDMKEQGIAAMKKHYYYDDENLGVRYIILDTGDNGLTQQYTYSGNNYTRMVWIQLPWLIETLENAPEGYDVVVAGHMFTNTEASDYYGLKPFYNILSAYQTGSSGSVTVPVTNDNMKLWYNEDFTLTYNFEGKEDSTVFTVSGHHHMDASTIHGTEDGEYVYGGEYSDDNALLAEGGVLSICTVTDCVRQGTDVLEMGTDGENAFDIITITNDGRIVCTRIGAGESREFMYQ